MSQCGSMECEDYKNDYLEKQLKELTLEGLINHHKECALSYESTSEHYKKVSDHHRKLVELLETIKS